MLGWFFYSNGLPKFPLVLGDFEDHSINFLKFCI